MRKMNTLQHKSTGNLVEKSSNDLNKTVAEVDLVGRQALMRETIFSHASVGFEKVRNNLKIQPPGNQMRYLED
jgi:hypothetical protein